MVDRLRTPAARSRALALLALAQLVVVIDASIITVSLPSIGADLRVGRESLSWVINGYVLAFGGCLLLGGRLADLVGRRRVFLAGIALFTAASLAGGLAPDPLWLDVARAAQGLGAALASPSALSILTTTFAPGAERNRALSVWGAVGGAGGAIGVLAGGLLTEFFGWRWVLIVNVPLGVLLLALGPLLLPAVAAERRRQRLDLAGALSLTTGLALLVLGLVQAPTAGWASGPILGALGGGLALLVAFVLIERRAAAPLVPLAIFRIPALRTANLVGVLTGMALISMFFLMTLYLQQVLGLSALQAGLAYLPLSVAMIVSATAASSAVARWGSRPVLIAALLCVVAGLLWLGMIRVDGSFLVDVLGPSLLAGIGLGGSFVPITVAALTGTEEHQAGLASGLITASQQLGGAIGLALSTTLAATVAAGTAGLAGPTAGYAAALRLGAGFALAAVVVAVLLPGRIQLRRAP